MRKIVHVLLEKAVGNATSTSNNTRAKMIQRASDAGKSPSCVFAMQTKDTKIKAGIYVYRLQDEIAQKILQHGFIQGITIAG